MNNGILEILKENNEMLKRIFAHIEMVEDPKYIEQEYIREFMFNVAADILVEMMEPEKRKEVYNILIKKGL